jgi:hypothetical protein
MQQHNKCIGKVTDIVKPVIAGLYTAGYGSEIVIDLYYPG